MALAPLARSALGLLLLLAAALTVGACDEQQDVEIKLGSDLGPVASPTPEFISATVLIEADPASPRWFRDLRVRWGANGYELLEEAAEGDLEADWFPEYRSHFVKSILGVAPEGADFWGAFVWSEAANGGAGGWEPLPIGADLFSVKDGHVMAWAIVPYNPDAPQLPNARP